MKIKGKILISVFALAFLALIAIADIPPPPVNQNFGIYDTMMVNYNETMCRGCHTTSGTILNSTSFAIGGVPTRHHNLVSNSTINPYTNAPFGCTDCHPSTLGTGNGILLDRNCMDCHNATAFWGDSIGAHIGNFTRPHHNTTYAQLRNCKFCHGASVDDYNDGHYIPQYNTSEVTPSALYKVFNSTSGRVWGGCLACHAQDTTNSPPIFFTEVLCGTAQCPVNGKYPFAPVADGINNVHHNEILGITGGSSVGDQCLWCHTNIKNVFDIRGCETCHSVRAIHNIQVDFANTSTLIGYGHIGSNNPSDPENHSWDCKGCHAWYDAGDVNPFAGAIVPEVQLVTPTVFYENTPTVITLTGTNFVQTNDTTVVNIDDTTNLTPKTISNGQIIVTVNLPAGNHYIKVVKTDPAENVPKPSAIKSLTVVGKVTINSAMLKSGVITIKGSGFGTKPATNAQLYVSVNHAGNQIASSSIDAWKDNEITAMMPNGVTSGDQVTVLTGTSGEAKAIITEATSGCIATLPGSGPIGFDDFQAFAAAYSTSQGNPNYNATYDFNHDGRIAFDDFQTLAAIYGTTCRTG